MSKLIILRKMRVEAANVHAGLTWGFPAMTAILGFTHALSRKLNALQEGSALTETAVISHECNVLSIGDFDQRFCITRNPNGKNGAPPSIQEEAKAHLTISLVIKADTVLADDELVSFLERTVPFMRFAGGQITTLGVELGDTNDDKLVYSLLPGYALTERADLLGDDPLTSFIELGLQRIVAGEPDANEKATWSAMRRAEPNIVPIMTGYRAVSPLYEPGQVKGSRCGDNPFAFCEPIHSVGQWVYPARAGLENLFWRYETTPGFYRCANVRNETESETTDYSDLFAGLLD